MPIIPASTIPISVDVNDPQNLESFLIAMKQYVEDMALKGKQMQEEVRTTAPSTDDLIEGEDVRYNQGGVRRTYTMIDGEIRVHTET